VVPAEQMQQPVKQQDAALCQQVVPALPCVNLSKPGSAGPFSELSLLYAPSNEVLP